LTASITIQVININSQLFTIGLTILLAVREDGTLSYIKFRSDYDDTIYFWFPAFNLLESGDLDYFNVSGDNVYNATGKWTFECKSD
jgi:hypothetical protein